MGYYNQPVETTVPMDQLMDLDFMSKSFGIEMIALNGTLADFHKNVLGGGKTSTDIVTYLKWFGKMKDASQRIVANTRAKASAATTPVVFAKGRWYSGGKRFIEPWYHKHVRYSPYLLKLSLLISKKFFNNDFDAFHVRLGDYWKKAKLSAPDGAGFVDFALSNGFSRDRPIYLATDGTVFEEGKVDTFTQWFKPFAAFKKVIPETRLIEDEEVALAMLDFKNRLPASDVYRDIFGTVEQLVCARARTFVGTSVSTFTKTIVQKRVHLQSAVPDMKLSSWPWEQGKTFTIRWSGRMVFHSLTQNLKSGETPEVAWNAKSKRDDRALQAIHDRYLATLDFPAPQ
ncbi:GDP-fucose protein O-fucosyltransferase 2 [Hondaea fermentalgiana]|uniref:GDP-fucose protein O-fucosyltransferase 2 n=1 Tax=Hondaea fermentalgiana TaxID=2315210 RepID=A0A2R5GJX2_9STRA|nr:GDP-fucose protein O-fucosyltransferase 2 [Hondaea fermentalgiana]|eukprot:GBG31192.1 GDP-fucose protein O-fucosyltransferase 2 [Hondaea fermentalgiana]